MRNNLERQLASWVLERCGRWARSWIASAGAGLCPRLPQFLRGRTGAVTATLGSLSLDSSAHHRWKVLAKGKCHYFGLREVRLWAAEWLICRHTARQSSARNSTRVSRLNSNRQCLIKNLKQQLRGHFYQLYIKWGIPWPPWETNTARSELGVQTWDLEDCFGWTVSLEVF